ncbi:MAG: hypothetical protein KDB68_09700 [Planctomycetes bacterium]|nr:hypothetical protein [Planctomycetota bacterium]
MASLIPRAKPSDFKIGVKPPYKAKSSGKEKEPLGIVYHVTHIEGALQIAHSGQIRAHLVSDTSRMNAFRVEVVWLSPNEWFKGSMYGQIRFVMDWNTPIKMETYWVEAMAYTPPAPRILFAMPADIPTGLKMAKYDPKVGDGPWYVDAAGMNWWHGDYTLEFMYMGDLDLKYVKRVDFVPHHSTHCLLLKAPASDCPDASISEFEAGACFVAGLICRGLPSLNDAFQDPKGSGSASPSLRSALSHIGTWFIPSGGYSGSLTTADPMSPTIAHAMFAAMSRKAKDEVKALARMFVSADEARSAIKVVMARHFSVTASTL